MKENKYTTIDLIKRFLPYFKPYKKIMIFDLICAFLTTICEIVLPMIIRYLTNTAQISVELLSFNLIFKLGFIYLILRVIDIFANFYMTNYGHVMGSEIETDMRRDLYEHLQNMSVSFYNNTKIGQLMGRITNDLFEVTEFAHHCPEEFFIAFVKIITSFIILSNINILLTISIFLFVPVMFLVCMKINKKVKKTFMEQKIQIGELNANIEDSLLGQKVVKAFTNEDIENEKFQKGNKDFLRIKKRSYYLMGLFNTSTRVFDGLMYLTIIFVGGLFLKKGIILPGDMVAYVMYVSTLITTIRRIIEFAEQFQRGITGIERFYEIIDEEIEIYDEINAYDIKDVKGNIEFKNVSFEYSDDNNQIFTNLNLNIKPNEKVAIVGPSGGGKTTLCNLIPRFFNINSGEILIDGHNIKNLTLKSLRQSVGIVQQDVYLFSGTVYDNILYGNIHATREEVIEAAKLAGADEFISKLKNGYDTYIGERGVKLSGGQKQRISIARVFLKKPSILILDEATSALDNESEFLVANALSKLSENRTSITIAHRLSSIKNSDRIIVLTENGIVEEGTHSELINKNGVYANFYNMAEKIK